MDHLQRRRLAPKTITCHLQTMRLFFDYLIDEEGDDDGQSRRQISIRLPKPLPRHLKDDQVADLLAVITKARDRAMFMLMLRSGLRVEEVARLTVDAVEYQRRQLFVANGKGAKDRVVYLSDDARRGPSRLPGEAILEGERSCSSSQKGPMRGKPISVRGIQKRIEYYARISGVKVSCHSLRHTMATQLLNADAPLSYPGPFGPQPHHDDPALLPRRQPQGSARLLRRHGSGAPADASPGGGRRGCPYEEQQGACRMPAP